MEYSILSIYSMCKKTMNMEENNKTPSNEHGECCEECKRTCKRNFWTEVLRTVVKIGTAVLAALGLAKSGGFPED